MCTTRAGRPIDMLGLVASSPATRDEAVPSADQKRPTCHESGRGQPTDRHTGDTQQAKG